MPLITAAAIAYAAGLLLGFGGVAFLGLSAAAAAAAAALQRRSARVAALALVAAAGVANASAARADADRCRRLFARSARFELTLHEDAAPGSYSRGVLRAHDCSADAAAVVESGHALAGDVVVVEASVELTGRRVILRDARVGAAVGRARMAGWRAGAGRAIDSVFRAEDRALARALLVADTRTLGPEVRERFASAGLVHALSVSGLHVGIIAGAVLLLLRSLRLGSRPALLGAVAITAGYVVLIGLPPPAVRAGVMLGVAAASQLVQRPTSPWASLALGALAPLLIDPGDVLDLGFQLSVVGMAALVASRALGRRVLAPRLSGWRLRLSAELLTSTVAVLATAPLVAWWFGRISLVAPLANLLAAPVIAALQPMLFLALLAAPVPRVGRFVADAAHPLLVLLDGAAGAAAAVPHASVWVAPSLLSAVLCGVGAAAAIVTCVSRAPALPAAVGAAALTVALWLPLVPAAGSQRVELHALDVGQGDAIALRTPRGRWLLFDAGRGWRGGDAGRQTVIPYLRRRGGELEAFVLSHPHADHVGGAASVLRALRPRVYWDAAFAGGGDAYRASLLAARELGIAWRRVRPGEEHILDGVRVSFLAPDSAWTARLRDPNEASTVALVTYGSVRFLLVGDAERGEEAWLLRRGEELRADVLKVGHHGSRTSSTQEFLRAVRPRVALVSVGRQNTYGHPSPEVMRALARAGALVLRTDHAGSVVVRTDGERITVAADGVEWPVERSPIAAAAAGAVPAP